MREMSLTSRLPAIPHDALLPTKNCDIITLSFSLPQICTSEDATTQTEDLPPSYPSPPSYEHLFLGIFPSTFSYHHTHSHSITHHHHHYASPTPQPPPSEDNK